MTLFVIAGVFLAIHNGNPAYLLLCVPLLLVLFTTPAEIIKDIIGTLAIIAFVCVLYLMFSGRPGFN